MKNKIHRIWFAVMAVWIACLMNAVPLLADTPDLDRMGSIQIQLDDLGTNRENVVFVCYRADEIMSVEEDKLLTAQDYKEAAIKLNETVKDKNVKGIEARTDRNGMAVFQNLKQGLYLITQKITAQYGTVEPFLICTPYMENGKDWIYDVRTNTKGERLTEKTTQEKVTTKSELTTKEETTKKGTPAKTGDSGQMIFIAVMVLLSGAVVFLVSGKRKYT